MPLPALRRGPLVDQAVEALAGQVESGTWPVGQRLPSEAALAEELEVGRSTVREAVTILAHLGMLEVRHGTGTFVTARAPAGGLALWLRRAAVRDVYEARRAVETEAARLAAARRTPEDLDAIDTALAHRDHAQVAASVEAFAEADLSFHRAVVAAAHNPVLAQLFEAFADAQRRAFEDLSADPACDRETAGFHAGLAAALRAGDPAGAAAATAGYLDPHVADVARLLDRCD
ncbi:MAG TPA: FCD domain-containing protein [Acidimicrobiales bacterium]|nr:FCD domain-containing protein [Acidimicrobiales bacterium]